MKKDNDYVIDENHENVLDDHGGKHVSLADRTEAFGIDGMWDSPASEKNEDKKADKEHSRE